jgi:hypothetical protein
MVNFELNDGVWSAFKKMKNKLKKNSSKEISLSDEKSEEIISQEIIRSLLETVPNRRVVPVVHTQVSNSSFLHFHILRIAIV